MDLIEKAADRLRRPGEQSTGKEAATKPSARQTAKPPRRTMRRERIDFERLNSIGIITPLAEHSKLAEEFRIVKRPLLLKAFASEANRLHNGRLILVTSSKPNEGKTFCALSLALSIASERDLTVLLVDADVSNPQVLTTLGIKEGKGLVDLMVEDHLDLADVLIRTDLENFSILPSGRRHHLATELLASERMGHFVEEVAKRYRDRVIIFDSPPTLASSVPGVLALHVGQTVYIVEADRTGEGDVKSGLGMISACKNVGLLLNKSRSMSGYEKFGAYYGYNR